jgi:hypothetical protein
MGIAQSVKNNNFCHDCGKKIEIQDKEIKNGVSLVYSNDGEKIKVFKCLDCFQKNQSLINFRKCEVYSRVVGYIRPVQQWNIGKKREFQERKEFKAQ